MTRKRFIRVLRGAGMTSYGIRILLTLREFDPQDYADILDQIRDSVRTCYQKHGTPLPKELRIGGNDSCA